MQMAPSDVAPPRTNSGWRLRVNGLAPSRIARHPAVRLALAMAVLAIAGCDDESPTGPSTGPLVISATTTGDDVDDNDYFVVVYDGVPSNRVAGDSLPSNGTVAFAALPAANYFVEIHGVAENCSVSSANPQTVTVSADSSTAHFDVHCAAIDAIVFGSNRDGDFDLYVMNADGSGLHHLTTDSLNARYPTWSRDGSQVAFVRSIDGGDGDIWIINADGTGLRAVTSDAFTAGIGVTWSGDGKRLAFASDRTGGTDFDIYTIDTSGSDIRRVTVDSANDVFPRWSSDSTRILFHSDRSGNSDLYTIHPDGTGLLQITTAFADDRFGAWSPADTHVTFVSTRAGGDMDVFTTDSHGTSVPAHITFDTSKQVAPSWRWDASRMVFVSQAGGDYNVYTMKPDGTDIVQLTTAPGTVLVTDWKVGS